MRIFNFEKFKTETSDKIEETMKDVPDEWKAEAAGFIAVQVTIFGATTVFEGIGILEHSKLEYLDVCNEVLEDDDDDETDVYLN